MKSADLFASSFGKGTPGTGQQTDLTAAHCQLIGGSLLIPYARGNGFNTGLGADTVLAGEGFCCHVCDVAKIDTEEPHCLTQQIRPSLGDDTCDSSAGIAIRSHDILTDTAYLTCCAAIVDDDIDI